MARLTHTALREMPLHTRIKAAREQAGLRQEDLAERLGVSRYAVLRWERAENQPTGENAAKLAGVLRYPAELFEGPPQPLARRDLEGRLEELAELVVQQGRDLERLARRVAELEGRGRPGSRTGELRR